MIAICVPYREDDMKMQNYQECDMSASFHVQVQLEGVGWVHFCNNCVLNFTSHFWELVFEGFFIGNTAFLPVLWEGRQPLTLTNSHFEPKGFVIITMLTILGKQFANLRSLTSQAPSKIQATAEEQNLHTSDLHYTPIRVKIAPLSFNLIFYTPSQCTQFGTC